MRELLTETVSVKLTPRQRDALQVWAQTQQVKPGTYLRQLITDDVPPECYRPLAPPPGQLTIEEGEA